MANKTENGQKKHMKKFLYNFEQTRLFGVIKQVEGI